jgi:hypothetical protein
MNATEAEAIFDAVIKYLIPGTNAAIASIEASLPQDKADALAALAAGKKVLTDGVDTIVAAKTAVLAALNPTAPAE